MALPGFDVAAIRHYCEQRVPPHALDEVRVEAEVGRATVTIIECRPPWREDDGPEWTRLGIARLRWVAKDGHWLLCRRDRNERWHRYDGLPPSRNVLTLLDEIDQDPTGIFWG